MNISTKHLYRLIPNDNNDKLREEQNNSFLNNKQNVRQSRGHAFWSYTSISILLFISLCLNCLQLARGQNRQNLDKICNAHTSQYESPVTESIDIKYSTVRFNASVTRDTIYRRLGDQSKEVDAAWEALGTNYRPSVIPEEDFEKYGIHQGQVKKQASQGGGYIVYVEVMHHLHCLNLLRQTSYWNYDYYRKQGTVSFKAQESDLIQHAGHCLDIIRQQLICKADVGIFGSWWVKYKDASVDFNTNHKCKNFEDIRKWAEDHQLESEGMTQRRLGDTVLDDLP